MSDRDRELSRASARRKTRSARRNGAQREKERENSYYDQGQQALDRPLGPRRLLASIA